MYIYEEIIEPFLPSKEEYILFNILNNTIKKYNLKEFITKIETRKLTNAEVIQELDNYRRVNGLYFYLGVEISLKNLMKILENDFKKVIIKIYPTEVVEIADTLTLKNNIKYMKFEEIRSPNSIYDLH